jgi:hypothetical protein
MGNSVTLLSTAWSESNGKVAHQKMDRLISSIVIFEMVKPDMDQKVMKNQNQNDEYYQEGK